jgi:hypothetical protein
MRFFSLLDRKKRLFRTSLNTRSCCTFFRKRFSSFSCDSPDLNVTVASSLTSLDS